MNEVKFIDSSFNDLPPNALKDRRYAVDLGILPMLKEQGGIGEYHAFLLLKPIAKNCERYEADRLLWELQRRNPNVRFVYADHKCYDLLNNIGIEATNNWESVFVKPCDTFETADVFVVIGFEPDASKNAINLL